MQCNEITLPPGREKIVPRNITLLTGEKSNLIN